MVARRAGLGATLFGTCGWGRGGFVLAGLTCLCAGCFENGAHAQRREALAREQQERMARLERIEARLLGAVALRAEWSDLRTRHGRVTELACENLSEHALAIVKHEEKERDKGRKSRNRRVAALTPDKAAATDRDVPPPGERASDRPTIHR